MLPTEEYIEQAYFFRTLGERLKEREPIQVLLRQVKHELLASTKLPLAIDFLDTELRHSGTMAPAMRKLQHYFSPFQTFLVNEAEYERGRFDIQIAVKVLENEADYRSKGINPQGLFMYQFETLCRNRLRYDRGLKAMSEDPMFDANWQAWILEVRHQVGLVELSNLIFLRSQEYVHRKSEAEGAPFVPQVPILFGEKEGRIAVANYQKDPLFLFSALQRHLGYPTVPRREQADPTDELIPQLMRRMERLEVRLKIMEEESREGLDLTKFYVDPTKSEHQPGDNSF